MSPNESVEDIGDAEVDAELAAMFRFRHHRDPYDLAPHLLRRGPAYATSDRVIVTHFAETREVYRNSVQFRNGGAATSDASLTLLEELDEGQSAMLRRVFEYERPTLVRNNGEEHRRLRSVVQPPFTARNVEKLRSDIRARAVDLFDECRRAEVDGSVDLLAEFGYRLPLQVVLDIMGVSIDDEPQILTWAAAIGANRAGVVPELIEPALDAFIEFSAYLDEVIAAGRPDDRDHLMGAMLAARDEGVWTATDVTSNMINLLFAGHETTANLIGNGMHALLRHRDQWELLVEGTCTPRQAVEEALRFESPVQYNSRTAAEDVDIGGLPIPAGTQVVPMVGVANRDPQQFVEPDQFLLSREHVDHIAFGFGLHHCLGAFLARLEGEIAFDLLASTAPSIALADQFEPRLKRNRNIRGLEDLLVSIG